MGRDWYLDPIGGNNANGGTSLVDALADHQAAGLGALADNDRVLIVATASALSHIRPADGGGTLTSWRGPTWGNLEGLRVQPYGDIPVTIRGDCTLLGVVYTQVGTTPAYTASIDFGSTAPDGITFNYDASTVSYAGEGCHYGILTEAASAAAVQTTDFSFHYNTTTNVLTINVGGDDPNATGTFTAVRGGDFDLFNLTNMVGCRFTGIVCRLTSLLSSGSGYAWRLTTGSDNLWEDCEGWDWGNHGFGIVGDQNLNNVMVRCKSGGCGSGSTTFVHYSGSTTLGVRGARYASCKAINYSHLKPDVTPSVAALVATGFYTHTVSGRAVFDIEYRNCLSHCVPFTSPSVKGWGHNNLATWTGGRWTEVGRPLRMIDCQSVGDTSFTLTGPSLLQRCRLNYSNAGPNNSGGSAGVIRTQTDNTDGGPDSRCTMLFDSCDLLFNAGNATPTTQNIVMPSTSGTAPYVAGDGPAFLNCSMIDYGADTNSVRFFNYNNKGAQGYAIYARGCVIGYTLRSSTRAVLCVSDNVAASLHDFKACDYVGISGSWSGNTSFNTAAKWVDGSGGTQIDAHGRSITAAQAALSDADADGTGRPAAESVVYHGRGAHDVRSRLDVSMRLAMHGRGAWRAVRG